MAEPPIAFVYDRSATGRRIPFLMRLQACGDFARQQEWELGGWFADKGDDALSDFRRPGLDALLRCMAQVPGQRERYLLIYDWTRISNRLEAQGLCCRRVRLASGSTCSVAGGADGIRTVHGTLGDLVGLG